jgi:F0F1-type ATP synthase membrane subunit c/vacuolar-type H+-ATPase subunit K
MTKWILIFLYLFNSHAMASYLAEEEGYDGPAQWNEFSQFVEQQQHRDRILGQSFVFSGLVATVGGAIGYHSSSDPYSRGIYAIAQSIGVAAIGYGGASYMIGNGYNAFYEALRKTPSLSAHQRAQLIEAYIRRDKEEREQRRNIKAFTHGLISVVNLYGASRESDPNLKTIFQFMGGTNLILSIGYSFN